MKLRILQLALALVLPVSVVFGQCNFTVTISDTSIVCGDSVTITALGLSPNPALVSDFNGGSIGVGWASTQTPLFSNPCGPTLDGTPAAWFGAGVSPRTLTTIGFDLSCGAQVCFDLDFANDENTVDCEDPDAATEGVYFQYSIDGGITWVDIFYFQPNATTSGPYYSWNTWCFNLPPAAWTTNTMLQWTQIPTSGTNWDHWGVDNISVIPIQCGWYYDWGGLAADSNNVFVDGPTSNTSYVVSYTDGTAICSDTVSVIVEPWMAEASVSDSTIFCGDCVDLGLELTNFTLGDGDDFDPDYDPTFWDNISGGVAGGPCGSVGGNALFFDGTSARMARTVPLDASACTTLDFCLEISNVSSGAGCGNAGPGENVRLEYSTNAGLSWTAIATYDQSYFDANPGFLCITANIPVAAQINGVMFRWRQLAYSACTGCDTWSLDNISLGCGTPPVDFLWTPSMDLNDATLGNPTACLADTTTFTGTMTDPITGCTASADVTVYVDCYCIFDTLTANISQCENGNEFSVTGELLYFMNPGTGNLVVEVTNASGTFTQTYPPPFNDNTLFNYAVTGITPDGSPLTLTVYFSDDVSCVDTLSGVSPVMPAVTAMYGGDVYCPGATVNNIYIDVTGNGPFTIDYTIDGVPYSVSGATSPLDLGNMEGDYVLTNISDSGCIDLAIGNDSIVLQDLPEVVTFGGGDDYCVGDPITAITADVTGTGPFTIDYTLNGTTQSATSASSPVNFGTAPGVYVINTITDAACSNTASGTTTITVNPLPNVNAGQDFIACEGDQIVLSGSGAQSYVWNNGVTNGVGFVQPVGTTVYTVTGTDANGCVNTDNISVVVEGLPVVSFIADTMQGCEPLTIEFLNTSTTSSVLDNCVWDFGTGDIGNGCDTVIYEFVSGGLYTVTLTTTSINGCTNSVTYPDFIYVEENPDASFMPSTSVLISLNTEAHFTNLSTGAVNYIWDMGDSTIYTDEHPWHTFPDNVTSSYEVTLIAYSPLGCSDTITKFIQVNQEIIFYVPNTFTPDGDEFNQTFYPVMTAGIDFSDFEFYIYNRWGQLIWESHDPAAGWDGTYNGKVVQAGSYTWKMEFQAELTDERKMYTGHVNVLK